MGFYDKRNCFFGEKKLCVRKCEKLQVLRDKIYELIDNEIAQVKAGNKGHIIVKMNSLIDQQVIQKLYEASIGGVQVELIVRGICGLRAGVEGISENITVRSIVGRQLEHSRIFWFANGGNSSCICPVPIGCPEISMIVWNCFSRSRAKSILSVSKRFLTCICGIMSVRI